MKNLLFYFVTSGCSALVNLTSRIFYSEFLGFSVSVVCAYLTGMIVNFILSSIFVFNLYNNCTISIVFFKFFIVSIVGLSVTAISSICFRHILISIFSDIYLSELIAHMAGICMSFIISFVGHNIFTYRKTGILTIVRSHLSWK